MRVLSRRLRSTIADLPYLRKTRLPITRLRTTPAVSVTRDEDVALAALKS
jgi:hypothetical protein